MVSIVGAPAAALWPRPARVGGPVEDPIAGSSAVGRDAIGPHTNGPEAIQAPLISPSGSPAKLVRAWAAGEFELVVSPSLMEELRRALGYPKVARLIPAQDADAFVSWLSRSATLARNAGSPPPVRSSDLNDDYLIALAAEQNAVLVTGDRHLLAVAGSFPIHEPAEFLAMLASPAG